MDPIFLKGRPAAFIKGERMLIIGDLHIGKEAAFARSGVHFAGASKRLADSILEACRETKARKIVFLGDVKESVGYPDTTESRLLKEFFNELKGFEIYIAKGNHDAHLDEILLGIGVKAQICKELIFKNLACIHGNAMPSEEAMSKRYLFTSHLHAQALVDGQSQKVWITSEAGGSAKKWYKKYNKKIKLVVAPAFSQVVPGRLMDNFYSKSVLLFRKGVFSWAKAKVYSLDNKLLGSARSAANRTTQG